MISTWNERQSIPEMLAALRSLDGEFQLLFVDGGSTDGTVEWLQSQGAPVIRSSRGRGAQMAAGADATSAPILWFLHADCPPHPGGLGAIESAVRDGAIAGYCLLAFRGEGAPARWMTWLYPKLARFGLVYGDAGIFVTRSAYLAVGGFRDWPLFEDLDLITRLNRFAPSRVRQANTLVQPSARRFQGAWFPLVFAQWVLLHLLFWAGVPPRWLARLYRPFRQQRPPMQA